MAAAILAVLGAGVDGYRNGGYHMISRAMVRWLAGVLAVMSLAVSAGMARAERCAGPDEQEALAMRVLQSDLMVAALNCPARVGYNAFVERHRHNLGAHARVLSRFFTRLHGGGGDAHLNSFITRMANQASERSIAMGDRFCAWAGGLFVEVQKVRSEELGRLAVRQPFAASHGFAACTAAAPTHLSAEADD